jgi:hypothetical protein
MLPMQKLNLPEAMLKVLEEGGKASVWDRFRKRYVVLTPEEWVRQHFLHWLVGHMDYPEGLLAVETSLKYGQLKKRADAMVYSRTGQPLMIIECKAPAVELTQDVFDQIARYNFMFRVEYMAVTNGMKHYCCRQNADRETWTFLEKFPVFPELVRKQV